MPDDNETASAEYSAQQQARLLYATEAFLGVIVDSRRLLGETLADTSRDAFERLDALRRLAEMEHAHTKFSAAVASVQMLAAHLWPAMIPQDPEPAAQAEPQPTAEEPQEQAPTTFAAVGPNVIQ